MYFASWTHYHFALYEAALTFEQNKKTLIRSGISLRETDDGGAEMSFRPLQLGTAIRTVRQGRMAMECFYFQAKLLLERVAHTFGYYFDMRLQGGGSAHTELAHSLKRQWARRSGARVPRELLAPMLELDRRVIKFRNDHIEHATGPESEVRSGLQFRPDDADAASSYFYVVANRPAYPALQELLQPSEVIERIESYLVIVITFFIANLDLAVIRDEHDSPNDDLWPAQGRRYSRSVHFPLGWRERAGQLLVAANSQRESRENGT
jgi:hypothetical protein